MLPGSFVERKRSCGRPNCHCADGKPTALNVPASLAEQVRQRIEMRHRLDAAVATICGINLRRFLKQKEGSQACPIATPSKCISTRCSTSPVG
jgi:hypothetical protein